MHKNLPVPRSQSCQPLGLYACAGTVGVQFNSSARAQTSLPWLKGGWSLQSHISYKLILAASAATRTLPQR